MKAIVFTDAVKLRSIIEFARANNCLDELGRSLVQLLTSATIDMIKPYSSSKGDELKPSEGSHVTVIGADWAPHSLGWAIFKGRELHMEGGSCIYNGGFIYDGPGCPANGSFPSLTVSLDPAKPGEHKWGIHT